ncbi:MAG: sigma-70 family RNA polymerase sigma factor [Pseudomonadota bacterium]|nr:sigma-70 family RNA polymerase sigma factor [Pseudomonadota bacterium]
MSDVNVSSKDIHKQIIEGAQLNRYLNRHANSADEAADIYQESILRVLEQSRRHRIDNPLAYAIRVARNLLSARGHKEDSDDIDSIACSRYAPADHVEHAQTCAQLSDVLENMPPLRKKVFILRRVEGESRQQIARQLDISVDAVSKHLSRAMADVQLYLDRHQ